jgi:hypothetical protein
LRSRALWEQHRRGWRSISKRRMGPHFVVMPPPAFDDDPAHCGIMAQTLGVVHIFVTGELPENRLPQHPDESMPAVLACASVSEHLARHHTEAERVVEFAIGEQSGVGGHDRTAKLKHQSPVEIEPESLAIRFTRRVRHGHLDQQSSTS